MTRVIWVLAWSAVVLWSLMALVAYGVIDLVGTAVTVGAAPLPPDSFRTGDPPPFEWLYPFAVAMQRLGLGLIGIGWFLVSAAILGTAWISTRLYRAFLGSPSPHPELPMRGNGRVASPWGQGAAEPGPPKPARHGRAGS
jgi:hypothetical protein